MDTEQQVAKHYGREGLEEAILAPLKASGKNIDRLSAADLFGADEFHLGWRAATIELAKDLGLESGLHVLDVGSGIGGPARYFAGVLGCRVVGIDLTPEFVEVANSLTRRCGLTDRASFQQASALVLPFAAGTFDTATLIHVGMNIKDKGKVFSEVRRVLKSGGHFGVYEVMRTGGDELPYPMPWAETAETSFVETPDTYRQLLAGTGFAIEGENNRREFVSRLWRESQEKAAKGGAPILSLATLMGPAAKERFANVMSSLERGVIAPVEMIARAV